MNTSGLLQINVKLFRLHLLCKAPELCMIPRTLQKTNSFLKWNIIPDLFIHGSIDIHYEGGSICNENPFITPSTNALGFYAICQTKDQSVAVIMVHVKLFNLTKFSELQTF